MLETNKLDLKGLAKAVKDEHFRETLKELLELEEASVFEEYSDEYQRAEMFIDKKDS